MSTQQITSEAMALPLAERVLLAQALWESLDADFAALDEANAVRAATERDRELSAGIVVPRSHDEVMQAARRAIECV
jgi:hypothetical protein